MTRMPDFSADLGPVEGAARRLEHRMGAFFHHRHEDAPPAGEVTHMAPLDDGGRMPCCGSSPFDVPRADRMTIDPSLVTCPDAPQPAAEAPQPSQPPQEETMSLQAITDIEAAVKDAAAKFEQVDHDALAVVDAIQAHPAANEAFGILGVLTGLPSADFDTALKVLRMVLVAAGGQFPASDGSQQ